MNYFKTLFNNLSQSAKKYTKSKKDLITVSSQNFKDNYLIWPPKLNFKENVQKFAGGMMTVIVLLVIVGFFVGIGTGFSKLTTRGSFMNAVWAAFNTIGFKIMGFLPLWFAIGLSFSIAKSEKGWAAMNALFALISINALIGLYGSETFLNDIPKEDIDKNSLWTVFLGLKTYNTGIFLGMVIGLWVAGVHNRTYNKKLPAAFAFFGGPKFAIIKVAFYVIPLAAIFYFVWPPINNGIVGIGKGIGKTGLIGTFLFGAIDKTLLPFGLHHLIAFPIEYTKVGGIVNVSGIPLSDLGGFKDSGVHNIINGTTTTTVAVEGVRNIINMQAASLTETNYIIHNFTSGRILFQIGGYAGISTALILVAKKENRNKVASLTIPAAMTAAFVGISEPIEYTFLFTAPLLYFGLHVPLAGLAYVLTEVTDVSINGHAFFFMISNISQPDKVHAMSLLYLVPIYYILYAAIFFGAIKLLNANTPGRGVGKLEIKLFTKSDYKKKLDYKSKKAKNISSLEDKIIKALGGSKNIISVENCATRLRISVKDSSLIKEKAYWLTDLKARGVVFKKGSTSFQIIYGPIVQNIATNVRDILNIK